MTEKKYLVSEEELEEFAHTLFRETNSSRTIDNFLKSKQEVELLAEGEIGINGYDISIFDDKNVQYIDDVETWEKYQGKHIKLYIWEEGK